jgi:neutral trehalase
MSSARDVSALRKDNKTVDASQRPTNDNYNRYIHLIDLLKKCQYDDTCIAASHPFLVQDVMFNALLIQSNKGLLAVGKKLKKDVTEIEGWIAKATKAMNDKLWDEATGFYYAFDLRLDKKILVKTSAGLMPLFANICSQTQANRLVNHIEQSFIKDSGWLLCPSTAADEKVFDPLKYWRGPIWINVNWMLYHGLKKYGSDSLAYAVKIDSITLIEANGFFEYFDPRPEATRLNTAGLGADAFSWTASIYLDFKNNEMLC